MWIILSAIILLVAFGVYNNPDRKNRIDPELEVLLIESQETREFVTTEIQNNKICFEDNELEVDKTIIGNCIKGIQKVIDKLHSEREIVIKLENYRTNKGESLSSETKLIVENSLKLNNSKEYQNLINSTVEYFKAHIEYYVFLRDELGNRSLDDLSENQVANLISISDRTEETGKVLQSQRPMFNDYLKQNYNQEFIDLLNLTNK